MSEAHASGGDLVLPVQSDQAHAQFVEVLHDVNAVVWEMDARSWRFTYVSPRAERLFGYPIARWYDEPTFWQDTLLHPEDREWCVHFCTRATGECRNHAFLYRARTADGRILWVKDVVRVLADATGAATVMRGVMVDVTDKAADSRYVHGGALDYDAPELADLRAALAA